MAIASVLLGIFSIIGIIVAFMNISFGALPTFSAIVGIVLGIMEIKYRGNKKLAITGIVICIIYFIAFIIVAVSSAISMRNKLGI